MNNLSIKNYNNNIIPVVIASDDNYAIATATCIYSILEKTQKTIDFFILSDNISETNKQRIINSLNSFDNFRIQFIDMEQYELNRFPEISRFKISCFSRYFIPEICSNYDKVIYTDADVIFMEDIGKYYNIDLEDYGIAAVPEEMGKIMQPLYNHERRKKLFNIDKTHQYFANGNIIINCEYWRKNDITKKLCDKTLELQDKLVCPDLDVMNIIFENNYKKLHFKYCCCVHRFHNTEGNLEMEDGFKKPFIIHYSGMKKPWEHHKIPFAKDFLKIFKKTKFYGLNYIISEKIFSIKESSNKKHKIVQILNFRFKFKQNLKKRLKKDLDESFHTYQRKHKVIIEHLNKKVKNEKLKVCFLVSETQKWNMQSLYDEMEQSNIFEPFVLVTRLFNNDNRNSYEHCLKFFKEHCKNVKIGFNTTNNEYIDIKNFAPDIVFFQQPWELDEKQNAKYVSDFALPYYFPYSISHAPSCMYSNLEKFFITLQKFFIFSEEEKIQLEKIYGYKNYNISVVGHPKLDIYSNYTEKNNPKKYIIYAPHHSLEKNSLNYATFKWSGKFILEWAKAHPEFKWIFKPHARLKNILIQEKIMSPEEVEQYYEDWANLGIYYNDGDYFDIFKNSKCLITDCGSFLIEYLPTEQPIIHLRNTKAKKYMSSSQLAIKTYYKAWNLRQLKKQLKLVLIEGKDPQKQKRIQILNKFRIKHNNATTKILEEIKKDLKIN